MAYKKGNVPACLHGKGVPQSEIDRWIEDYEREAKGGDPAKAFEIASENLAQRMMDLGYVSDSRGRWHSENDPDQFITVQMTGGIEVITEEGTPAAEKPNGYRYNGIALVDGIVSQNGRGMYYSQEFNTRCMEATNKRLAEGKTITVYSRHGKAIGSFLSLPTGLPIGHVPEALWRDGDKVRYKARVVPTAEGSDCATLIREGVMKSSSVRIADWKSKRIKLNGKKVEALTEGVIIGIDLADEPGIPGANIEAVTEEMHVEEDTDVDWGKITLEELIENRKDLLEAYATDRLAELQAQLDAKGTDNKDAEAVDQLREQLAEATLNLKIEQAAQTGVGKAIAIKLRDRAKTPEDIVKELQACREEAINEVLANSSTKPGKTVGKADVKSDEEKEDEDDVAEEDEGDGTLDETQSSILHLAG